MTVDERVFKNIKGIFVSIDKEKVNFYGNNLDILGVEPNIYSIELTNIKEFCKDQDLELFNSLIWNGRKESRNIQIEIINKRQEKRWIDIQGKAIGKNGKLSGFEGYITDITNNDNLYKTNTNSNYIDEVTGIYNDIYFRNKIEKYLNKNKEYGKSALLILGLDNFKYINDSFGKMYGNLFLKTISLRLKEYIKDDCICRFTGDEFLIFLKNVKSEKEVENKAKELIEIFNNAYNVEGKHIYVTTSIGVAIFSKEGEDFDTLLKNADAAMYIAKKNGKNQYQIFNDDICDELDRLYTLERSLIASLENEEIFIVFQPKVILSNNTVNGFEALVRWKNKELGFVSPNDFIPIAEETGLIIPIGKFVLKEVFVKAKALIEQGYNNFKIAYNLSEIQLREGAIIEYFKELSQAYGVDGKYIEIEITESMIVKSFDRNIESLMKLKSLGATIALDDFGTGYSSLNHLTKLPIDVLKIDRSFVIDMLSNCKSKWIIENIIELSHKLGIEVVAEGVEMQEQVDYLKDIYCDTVQGYFYSKPDVFENVSMLLEK